MSAPKLRGERRKRRQLRLALAAGEWPSDDGQSVTEALAELGQTVPFGGNYPVPPGGQHTRPQRVLDEDLYGQHHDFAAPADAQAAINHEVSLFPASQPPPDPGPPALMARPWTPQPQSPGRVKLWARHQPKHALPAQAQAPSPEPPRRPTFTPAVTAAGPRHPVTETERILAIARRRADAAPVPPLPANPPTSAQALAHADRLECLKFPAYDATDGYGSIPEYVALMRHVSRLTGTTSRYEFPAAWPLPVLPEVRTRGLAVTDGTTPPGEPMPGIGAAS